MRHASKYDRFLSLCVALALLSVYHVVLPVGAAAGHKTHS